MLTSGQTSGFFDSTKVMDTVEGFPRGDKAVDSEFLSAFVGTFFSDGVARGYGDGFRVTADGASGGVVTVGSGRCLIRGRIAMCDTAEELDLGFSEDARTIIVAQRLDVTTAVDAAISKIVLTAPTAEPANTNTVQDIWLARVTIPGGTVNLTQSMITDLRGSAVCPWVIAPLADADWEALPPAIQTGFTRVATESGGTADAFTAVVPNFDPSKDQYACLAVRFVPTVNSNANATLAVNGGTAYPLYRSDGDPCALYSLRAGIPVDCVFYQGKYFFKSAGSGAEYTKYATGAATYARDSSGDGVATCTSLTFKPRLIFLATRGVMASGATPYYPDGCVCLCDAAGQIMRSITFGNGTGVEGWWWDSCTGGAEENGFLIRYPKGVYPNGYDVITYHAYA